MTVYDVEQFATQVGNALQFLQTAGDEDPTGITQTGQVVQTPAAAGRMAMGAGRSGGTYGDYGISQRFGGSHDGVDLETPMGTRLVSPLGGTITHAGFDDPEGYGAWVQVTLDDGSVIDYGHLSGINVENGQRIEAGSLFGLSGGDPGSEGAGSSTGPHLHFRVHQGGVGVDPMGLLASGWTIFGG